RVQNFEIQFLQEATKFVRDFKSLAKEADESLDKQKSLELKIKRLLKASVSHDIMSIVQNGHVDAPSDLRTELDRTKEKLELCIIKNEKEYAVLWNNCASNTLDPLNQKLESKIVELEFKVVNYERKISHLKITYKNLFDSIKSNQAHAKPDDLIYENAQLRARGFKNTSESMKNTSGTSVTPHVDKRKLSAVNPLSKKLHASMPSHYVPQPIEFDVVKHRNVIAPGMFKINPSQTPRVDLIPNKQSSASIRTNPITNSQCHVIVKENVVQICLWCVDSGCSKHMTENIKLLINFVWKFLGTVRFRNDHITAILGYEVAFRRNTCFIRDLDGVDLLKVKSKRASHPPKPVPNSKQRLHLLHMDLCGPMRVASINGKWYVLVIVDDYSGYTWVNFLRTKDETPNVIKNFLKKISVCLQAPVIIVRTDNGTEFKNQVLKEYFDSVGITHETSAAKTLKQNGFIERRNRKKPDISYLYVFGALCYPKNDREDFGKLGAKGDIGFFIGYSANFVPYRVYNRRTKKIMETMNVTFDELSAMAFQQNSSRPDLQKAPRAIPAAPVVQNLQAPTASMSFQDSALVPTNSLDTLVSSHNVDATSQQHAQQQRNLTPSPTAYAADNVLNAVFKGDLFVNPFGTPSTESVVSSTQYVDPSNMHTFYQPYPYNYQWTKDHPLEQIIEEPSRPVLTRNQLKTNGDMCIYALTVSIMEPKSVKEALTDPAWIETMQEELDQFIRLDVWELVPSPDGIKPLTLKWLFKNKHDEEITFAQMEAISIFLAYIAHKGFTVDQMDVKTAFLHGSLKKDMYVCQPEGFIDANYPSHVYKLKKALYGLKQAPKAWYDELSTFLLQNGFSKGTIDLTLFTRLFEDDILVVQVYVDDIIFGSTDPRHATLFSDLMKSHFEMSMMGEMTFFSGLQVNQSPSGIFINQSKYVHEILKKYGLNTCDIIGTPMDIKDKLDLDQIRTPVDATKYRSMIGALMYLTSSIPDIVHATCVCARYQAHPTEKHLKEVKRIYRYLQGTINMGLWYTKDSGFELIGFSDANYAGCKDTFKSTSGGAQFLGEKHELVLKETRLYIVINREVRICVSICSLCSSPLDADTVSRLWLSLQQDPYLFQNRRDLPKDTPIDRLEVLRYDTGKRSKVRMGIMLTETELTLEQTQQGVCDEVSVKDHDIKFYCSNDIKSKIKILDHKHVEGTVKSSQDNKVLRLEVSGRPMKPTVEYWADPWFSWVFFLRTKDEISGIFKDFIRQIENQLNQHVKTIRCDNGIEFKNRDIIEFCASKGIKREYSNARTPKQNGVAKRKNRTLIEAARTMILVTKPQNKTPYELLTGFLAGYSLNSKAFKPVTAENKANITAGPKEAYHSVGIQDNINTGNSKLEAKHIQEYCVLPLWSSNTSTVKSSEAKNRDEKLIGDTGAARASSTNYVNIVSTPVNTASTPVKTASLLRNVNDVGPSSPDLLTYANQDDSQIPNLEDIYAVLNDGIFTSASYDVEGAVADFTNLESTMNIEPKKISQALEDESWVVAMPKELMQFKTQQVWILVDLPFRKKGHRQEEGIDYDEVFAPMARLEAIRIFLAFASYMGFIVYQMDVKSAFLYGKINEDVNVSQPLGFIDLKFPKKVYKIVKALYVIHQAPRAWYATLSTFLVKSEYRRGVIDKTLFIKKDQKDIMLVQVYVDDIIFGSTKKSWCDEFEALIKNMFQMSSMGKLTFFLGLQVKQKEDRIFISQDKYVAEILKKFDFISVKTASTLIETKKTLVKDAEAADVDVTLKTSHLQAMKKIFIYLKGQPKLGLWYPRESAFDLKAYSDSDYAGERKSTTGHCQFLGRRLITWQCKKQTIVATSTMKAKYVATVNCCGQVLWIQNQMLDCGFNFMNTKIYIDNESTICIVKNLVFHSKTKHNEIRHHFIRDAYAKKLIQVLKIHTDDIVVDLLTKAFDVSRFNFLIVNIGMFYL
nr:putative ribonuclease H-like domain-containing protein [Tanacetum cinerariifolium]